MDAFGIRPDQRQVLGNDRLSDTPLRSACGRNRFTGLLTSFFTDVGLRMSGTRPDSMRDSSSSSSTIWVSDASSVSI